MNRIEKNFIWKAVTHRVHVGLSFGRQLHIEYMSGFHLEGSYT